MDGERGASGPNNASLPSHHRDSWPAHLFVEAVEVVVAEDSEVSVADMIACVG